MRHYDLTPDLVTGMDDVDQQHRYLLNCANAVFTLGDDPADELTALHAARFLLAYVRFHFKAEEAAMTASDYPRAESHQNQHTALLEQVALISDLVDRHASFRKIAASLHVVLEDWLLQHIGRADRDFARFLSEKADAAEAQLPNADQLRRHGLSLEDIERVRVVHGAGEVSSAEMQLRLKNR
jgi:hemerythrin